MSILQASKCILMQVKYNPNSKNGNIFKILKEQNCKIPKYSFTYVCGSVQLSETTPHQMYIHKRACVYLTTLGKNGIHINPPTVNTNA